MNKLLTALTALALSAAAASDAARPPLGAGRFYPAKPKELAALVDDQLANAPAVPLPAGAEVVAVLVPHAGLEFSGFTAARAFKAVPRGAYDAVIVVGTSHYKQLEGAALYPGAYATIEGATPYAQDLARKLLRESPLVKADASAHRKEHSVEVELPYLRRVVGNKPLVALVMNTEDLDASRRIGEAIADAVKGRRVLLVASSDQSHFPSGGVGDAVDRTTLAALQTLDPAYFWLTNRFLMNRALPHLAVTYCGEGAVMAVMEAARRLGADKVRVLAHINSGDVVAEREYNHVVGYASALFTRERGEAPGRPALSEKEKKQLLSFARASVEAAAAGKQAQAPLSADPLYNLPAAVFVTLRAKDSVVRSRAGTTEPQESLQEAVVHEAAAAAQDGGGKPVTPPQALDLSVEVAVLSPARPTPAADIKPGDGVSLERDDKTGVLLPDAWKRLSKKDDFLGSLCADKAGLPRDCWKDPAVRLKTFSADTFGD